LFKIVNVLGPMIALLCLAALPVVPLPVQAAQVKILALGDSLTAGYGVAADKSLPAQLQNRLREDGVDATVINAGVSGDTTAGGLARVDWALAEKPSHALVALGANDALRGLDPEQAFKNLDAILIKLQAKGVKAMLLGMVAPPNLGSDYGQRFGTIYLRLAEKHKVPLYPFLLDGVASITKLNQADGMHPTAEGVAVIVDRIAPQIRRFLESAAGGASG